MKHPLSLKEQSKENILNLLEIAKKMKRKKSIPIIYIIIGATMVAVTVFGVIKYEDEITANVSRVLKPKIVVYNIVSTAEVPQLSEDLPASLSANETDEIEGNKQLETTKKAEESTTIIEKLKKEIEALKQQLPKIIYKEVIKEVPVPISTPISEPELTPLSTAITPQSPGYPETISNDSGQIPDFIIQSLTYYPLTPIEKDDMSFFATIKNQGNGTANPSMVSLSIDGIIVGKASTASILSNKAETITWGKIWKAALGTHIFEICVDADSEITESDETNNCYSSKFSVSKAPLLPDYIILTTTMSPANPATGDILSFAATVHNQGNATSFGSSFVSLKIDINNNGDWNIIAKSAFTDVLDQGGSEKEHWQFVWATISGTHKYEICADATSSINESNENNNCTSKIFIIP